MSGNMGEKMIRHLMTRYGLKREAAEFLVYVMHDGVEDERIVLSGGVRDAEPPAADGCDLARCRI